MLNPGSGNFRNDAAAVETLRILTDYRERRKSLKDVFDAQYKDMPSWGRGRFLAFFQNSLGLDLQSLAFMNLAWCATNDNSYPDAMLNSCFEKYGYMLLRNLAPDVVILCGSTTHAFSRKVAQAIPQCKVITTLHYAHRKGSGREAAEAARIRPLIHEIEAAPSTPLKAKVAVGAFEVNAKRPKTRGAEATDNKGKKYTVLREASLRESMRRYKDKGDERWELFEALLASSTRDAYMAKVGGFQKEMISNHTGKVWLVTAENFFDYELRNDRIALVSIHVT